MIKTMQPRHQKAFLKKLGDSVRGTAVDDFAKVQTSIDKTLDKVHDKLVGKTGEGEQLLSKYRAMIGSAASDQNAVKRQIAEIELVHKNVQANASKFISMVQKMCTDHYSWVRHQKFKLHVPLLTPSIDNASSKWASPTSSNAPKLDFYKCATDEKVAGGQTDLQQSVLPLYGGNTSGKKNLNRQCQKARNEFFLNTLTAGSMTCSSHFGGSKSTKGQDNVEVESLQESLQVLKMVQQEVSLHGSSRNTESANDDTIAEQDIVKIVVGMDDIVVCMDGSSNTQKPGMLERMRSSLFWASPDPKAQTETRKNESPSERSDLVGVQLEKVSDVNPFSMAASSPQKPCAPEQKLSVLDELDAYWEKHDAISAATNKVQFGIMNQQAYKQAQDMMQLRKSDLERAGAFCVGI